MVAQASVPLAPVRIGCSGWIYQHWRGLFYPEELAVKRWFAKRVVDALWTCRQTGDMPMTKASAALALATLPLAALPLAGCATLFGSGQASVHTLALAQTGDFGQVKLTPISVDEDSRCPTIVQCAWAGQVRLKVLVEPAGADHAVFATLYRPLGVDGGTLLLEQVTPKRDTRGHIPPNDYSFTLRYTPAGG
jgi:hypothetical protein